MALSLEEKELAAAVGFDESICEVVKAHTAAPLRRFEAFNEEFELQPADGLSSPIERQIVTQAVASLQKELLPRGYRAFWTDSLADNGFRIGEEVAVLKTLDPYSLLRLRRTNGGNYDVSMEDVIARLEEWGRLCALEIVGASGDWVAIQFETLPENICAFAEEVYEFCPDTVEQGVGLAGEQDHSDDFAEARRLCPELSVAMQSKLEAKKKRFESLPIPPELREMLKSSEGQTASLDMGIRLLALDLKRSNQLFLWWD